jgi:hypothetical protein
VCKPVAHTAIKDVVIGRLVDTVPIYHLLGAVEVGTAGNR